MIYDCVTLFNDVELLELRFPMPTTLLGSNKYDLRQINIEGATLI
jgi:hypothetical protein